MFNSITFVIRLIIVTYGGIILVIAPKDNYHNVAVYNLCLAFHYCNYIHISLEFGRHKITASMNSYALLLTFLWEWMIIVAGGLVMMKVDSNYVDFNLWVHFNILFVSTLIIQVIKTLICYSIALIATMNTGTTGHDDDKKFELPDIHFETQTESCAV
jgi:hypothetical protein